MAAPIRCIVFTLKNHSSIFSRQHYFVETTTKLSWCKFHVIRNQVRSCTSNSTEVTAHCYDNKTNETVTELTKLKGAQCDTRDDDVCLERAVAKSEEEQHWRTTLSPDQPPDPRLLRVAIIGSPNAGKSTLTNQLMRWKITSVSPKVHTTRHNVKAVFTEDDTQIVFLDTPGLLHPKQRKKHNLDMRMVTDPERSLESADLIAVLHDVSNIWTRNQLDPLVLQILHLHSDLPSILILNKVDLLKKKSMLLQMTRSLTGGVVGGHAAGDQTKKQSNQRQKLEDILRKYSTGDSEQSGDDESDRSELSDGEHSADNSDRQSVSDTEDFSSRHLIPVAYKKKENSVTQSGWTEYYEKRRQVRFKIRNKNSWPGFSSVFMVSALTGDGVDELRGYLQSEARPADWEFHSSLVTDQDPFQLACTYVWEKILQHLPREVPYHLYPEIMHWEVDSDGVLNIIMYISTKDRYYFVNLLGPKGATISQIAEEAKQELMNAFRCEMRLKLEAKLENKR